MGEAVVPVEAIQPDLNEFGKYIYQLMLSRGIKTFNALSSAMETDDRRVYRQTITKYAKGERAVQPWFARRLKEVLDLSESEERELAWALYRWG